MAESNSVLNLIVRLKDEASTQIKGFKSTIQSLQPQFKAMAAVGVAGFGAITAVGVSALKEFADSQKQATIANQALSNSINSLSTGALSKLQSKAGEGVTVMQHLQKQMQEAGEAALKLGFDDDQARLAFAKLYQVSLDVTQAQNDLRLAMDLAAFSGRSLEESAAAITKVHSGATRVLKEFGIEVEEGTNATDALRILQERTAGTAGELSKTLEGQTRILNEQFNNMKENIGAGLAPALTKLFEAITPIIEKISEWTRNNPELTANILLVTAAIFGLIAAIGTIGVILPAVITGFGLILSPIGLLVLAIGGLIAWSIYLYKNWEALTKDIRVLWNQVVVDLKIIWSVLKEAFGIVIDWMHGKIKAFTEGIQNMVDTIVNQVKRAINAISSIPGVSAIGSAIKAVGAAQNSIFKFATGGIVTRPTLGLVGEAGPEAIIPLSQAGNLGGNVTVNVYGDVTGQEIIDFVKESLMRDLRHDSKFSIV